MNLLPRLLLALAVFGALLGLPAALYVGAIIDLAGAAPRPGQAAEIEQALHALRRLLLLGTGLSLGVFTLLATAASLSVVRGVRVLTQVARRMAEGDLSARSHARGKQGLAALGQALDQLGAGLSGTLAELRAERDLLSGVLRGMQEGVLLLDREGRIVMLNPALQELLFRPGAESAKGRLALEVIRNAELQALFAAARQDGLASGEIELSGLRPRRALVRVAALPEDAGGRLLAVFVDVTDLRRLESLRRDFVANVSHELRTPVASIRSAAETLSGPALNDPVAAARFTAIIDRNAERLHRLVEDLLDLSRIESRAYQLSSEALSAQDALRGVSLLLGERATKKRQRLVLEPQPDALAALLLWADRRALEQVLVNLVDNAIRYCPEGATITLRASALPGGRVALQIRDTGPGIAAAHLPRLFERFYRVDVGRSREQGGTGLGLAIVKHLCEAMAGAVRVESQPGQGTTFTVELPTTAPAPGRR